MKLAILFLVLSVANVAYGQDSIVVFGTISNAKVDTVKIVLNENVVVRQSRTYYAPLTKGKFKLTIALKKPTYIYLQEGANYTNGVIAPGEDVGIVYNANDYKTTISLTGKAAPKFVWSELYKSAKLTQQIYAQAKIAKDKPQPFDHVFSFFDSTRDVLLNALREIDNIDSFSAYMMRSQVEGNIQFYKYVSTTSIFQENIPQTFENRSSLLTPASIATIKSFLKFREDYYQSPLYVSTVYNILNRHFDELVITNKMTQDLGPKYRYLDSLLPGKLKVPVMTILLEDDIRKANPAEELQKAITYVYAHEADPMYSEFIKTQMARTHIFKKGSKAPEFTIENERGEKVSLASFKGKVVYMDFWFASCGPCHSLFLQTKSVKEHFKNNKDVVFLVISIDNKDLWKKSLKQFKIPGYHAFTENRERRHPIISDYNIEGYPSTFIIDKKGNIFVAGAAQQPEILQQQLTEALNL
jgi:peroxiredoxin